MLQKQAVVTWLSVGIEINKNFGMPFSSAKLKHISRGAASPSRVMCGVSLNLL